MPIRMNFYNRTAYPNLRTYDRSRVVCKIGDLFGRGWQLDLRKSSQWYAEYPAMLAKWKHAVW